MWIIWIVIIWAGKFLLPLVFFQVKFQSVGVSSAWETMSDVKSVDSSAVVKYSSSRSVSHLRFYVRVITEPFPLFCVKIKLRNIIEETAFWRITFSRIFTGGYVKSASSIFSAVHHTETFLRDGVVAARY